MAFEITNLDIAQVNGTWYCKELITLNSSQSDYDLSFTPLFESELILLNRKVLLPTEYSINSNVLHISTSINTNDKLYIRYVTKDDINMAFEITRIDIAQIEGTWFYKEMFDLTLSQSEYGLLYVPIENAEVIFVNKDLLYQDYDYAVSGNSLRILTTFEENDRLYIYYATKDELNQFYVLTDELGNPIFVDLNFQPILVT